MRGLTGNGPGGMTEPNRGAGDGGRWLETARKGQCEVHEPGGRAAGLMDGPGWSLVGRTEEEAWRPWMAVGWSDRDMI